MSSIRSSDHLDACMKTGIPDLVYFWSSLENEQRERRKQIQGKKDRRGQRDCSELQTRFDRMPEAACGQETGTLTPATLRLNRKKLKAGKLDEKQTKKKCERSFFLLSLNFQYIGDKNEGIQPCYRTLKYVNYDSRFRNMGPSNLKYNFTQQGNVG